MFCHAADNQRVCVQAWHGLDLFDLRGMIYDPVLQKRQKWPGNSSFRFNISSILGENY